MTADIFFYRRDQLRNASKYTPANSFSCDLAKPALDQVQPRGARRCKMQNEPRMFFQPCLHIRVIVCSLIIQNHVHSQFFGNLTIDLAQEFQDFNISVPWITSADYFSLQNVQGCEKAGRTVTFVIVCHRSAASFFHGKPRLCTIQGLNLRFLVHTQHHGLVRWVQIDADNIRQFFHEAFVLGELESLHPVRLQPVRIPNSLHSSMADSLDFGHRSCRPVGRVLGGAVQGCFDNLMDFLGAKPAPTGSMRCIFRQPRRTFLAKAIRPQKNARSRGVQSFCNGVVRHAFCSEQADTGPQDNSLRRCFGTNPGFQNSALLFHHLQCIGWLPHALANSTAGAYCKDITETLH